MIELGSDFNLEIVKAKGKSQSKRTSKVKPKVKGKVVYNKFYQAFMYKEGEKLFTIIDLEVSDTITLYPTKDNDMYTASDKKSSTVTKEFLDNLSAPKRKIMFKMWSHYYDNMPVYKVEYIPTTQMDGVKLIKYG